MAAVAALTAETSDGVLSDPLNTFGVVDIPTATAGTITTSPLNAASESHHKCCCIKTSILFQACQLFCLHNPRMLFVQATPATLIIESFILQIWPVRLVRKPTWQQVLVTRAR